MVEIFFTMLWLAAWASLFFLKLLPVFVVLAFTERHWPENHSPVLVLHVILRQAARRPRIRPFLLVAACITIIALIDKLSLLDWVLMAAFTFMYTAAEAIGCAKPTAVYARAQAMARIHDLFEEFKALLASVKARFSREQKYQHADEDDIKGWIWIDMDNAPPLESGTSVDS